MANNIHGFIDPQGMEIEGEGPWGFCQFFCKDE